MIPGKVHTRQADGETSKCKECPCHLVFQRGVLDAVQNGTKKTWDQSKRGLPNYTQLGRTELGVLSTDTTFSINRYIVTQCIFIN